MKSSKHLIERLEKITGKKVILENNTSIVLNDLYFIKRVPFFKSFENNSHGNEVSFSHYKNWQGNDKAILSFGKDNGFIELPFMSVETKFTYFPQFRRDFDAEAKLTVFRPMNSTEHHFSYSTTIHITRPKGFESNSNDPESRKDEVTKHLVTIMFQNVIENQLKFKESFETHEGEPIPMEKIDSIVNNINKNLFKIEETLDKLKVSYF